MQLSIPLGPTVGPWALVGGLFFRHRLCVRGFAPLVSPKRAYMRDFLRDFLRERFPVSPSFNSAIRSLNLKRRICHVFLLWRSALGPYTAVYRFYCQPGYPDGAGYRFSGRSFGGCARSCQGLSGCLTFPQNRRLFRRERRGRKALLLFGNKFRAPLQPLQKDQDSAGRHCA